MPRTPNDTSGAATGAPDRRRRSRRRRAACRRCARSSRSRFGEPASSSPSRKTLTFTEGARLRPSGHRGPRGTPRSAPCRRTPSGRTGGVRRESLAAAHPRALRRAASRCPLRSTAPRPASSSRRRDGLAVVVRVEDDGARRARHRQAAEDRRRCVGDGQRLGRETAALEHLPEQRGVLRDVLASRATLGSATSSRSSSRMARSCAWR